MALLEAQGLEVAFPQTDYSTGNTNWMKVLNGVDLSLDKGERLGIVGESGAGKSMLAFALLNLLSEPGEIIAGQIIFDGIDMAKASKDELRQVRGNRISMIFQDPMVTLNPVLTIGDQMVEALLAHQDMGYDEARTRSIKKLEEVSIPSPERRFSSYPHELSGGLRQRVVIAIALLSDPEIIIADEPTTALDVTIQAEIMALLLQLATQKGLGLILITHDLAVVSEITQNLMVMYAGRVVETGPTKQLIRNPYHHYTRGLINALPQQNRPGHRLAQISGSMPTMGEQLPGCSFHPRCEFKTTQCAEIIPNLLTVKSLSIDESKPAVHNQNRGVACHHPLSHGEIKK